MVRQRHDPLPPRSTTRKNFQKHLRAFFGALESQAFARLVEHGTSVAIYARLPGDGSISRYGIHTFPTRQMNCWLGSVQHTTHILHTPGHYDFLEKASEEGSWTSPRHSSLRAAQREQRERTRTHPPLISDSDSSDGNPGLKVRGQCFRAI